MRNNPKRFWDIMKKLETMSDRQNKDTDVPQNDIITRNIINLTKDITINNVVL